MSGVTASESALRELQGELEDLEQLYKDIHSHPELSLQEQRTSRLVADRLRAASFEVTEGVGATVRR